MMIYRIGQLGRILGLLDLNEPTIEKAIVSILSGSENVVARVGNGIYPNFIPPKANMPAITYQQISGGKDYAADGEDSLSHPRIQIVCWDATYSGALLLAKAVRAVLSGYRGVVNSINIQATFLLDENDMPEIDASNELLNRFGIRQDWEVWNND